jgi:hypothetical protein
MAACTVGRMSEAPAPRRKDSESAFVLPDVPAKKEDHSSFWIGLGVAAVIALVLVCSLHGTGASGTEGDRSNAAISACENAVKDQLKAPSTAKFSNERYTDSDPSWRATGDVDAENSFGAMIRSHFDCDLTRGTGDTDFTVDSAVVT